MADVPLVLFEDAGWRRFGPVTTLRPVWELRLGCETLAEAVSRKLDHTPDLYEPREELARLVEEGHGGAAVTQLPAKGDVFLVNGRCVGAVPAEGLDPGRPWSIWNDGDDTVAAKLPASVARAWLSQSRIDPENFTFRKLIALWSEEGKAPKVSIEAASGTLLRWPWDLIRLQAEAISGNLETLGPGRLHGEVDHRAHLISDDNIHVAAGAEVAAGAVIDASGGPVILGEQSRVMPGAVIAGPAAIGPKSLVRAGAKLYGPLSVGPVCRLGGEIEGCVFIGFSNKQHDGFLGHSLVGEWVNFGADSNNSDLKNNYSPVSVTLHGEAVDTGEVFFGSIIGDHVKTGINTMLNTGTVVGIGTNIFGAGFPPKTIGAFRWGGPDGFELYDFDKFLDTARNVMARRDVRLSQEMTALLRNIHEDAARDLV